MAHSSNIVSRVIGAAAISPTTRLTLREAVHNDGTVFMDARVDFLTEDETGKEVWRPTAKGFHVRKAHFAQFIILCEAFLKEPTT